MSVPPPRAQRWWEAIAPGTRTPVAMIKVDRAGSTLEWRELPEDAVLRRRAQYTAGVEYIASSFGAAAPLSWQGDGVMLFLGGQPEERLPEHAFAAARDLWERVQIDLGLPARIAVHVAYLPWGDDPGTLASPEIDATGHLESAAPTGAVILSEDMVLALPESLRRLVAPLGTTARDGIPAYVLPAGAAARRDPKAFADDASEPLWEAMRRYAGSPEIRQVRYVGFRLQKKQPPSLDIREVFISPDVELRAPERRSGGLGMEREAPLVEPPWRPEAGNQDKVVSFGEVFASHRSIVVLGDPGSGKTTLLRWLAVTAAGGRFVLASRLGAAERLLPIPVSVGRLAELRRGLVDRGVSVPAALARYFHDRSAGEEGALREQLARELEGGRCLVLLDGLDEVRAEERGAVHRWLESFAAAYPKNRYVVSSRIVGFSGFELPDGVQAVIRPFGDEQVERYVRAFHTTYLRWEDAEADPEAASLVSAKLLSAIRESPRLRGLARNPFLLSALALIHRSEGRLPRHRVQAYELFARALCETWAEARRLVASASPGASIEYEEEALPILGELALAMHERYPTGVAPEAFVVETLARTLGERKGISGEEALRAAREFLKLAGNELQILTERGAGAWGFLHLTFQEFFTAAGLHAAERFEEVALARLFDSRWEEVLRLGVGYMALVQKRPTAARKFVEKVLGWREPEPYGWITSVLRKQVPIAALLAAEAGDALPAELTARVAREAVTWVCDSVHTPRRDEIMAEISNTDLAEALEGALLSSMGCMSLEQRRGAPVVLALLKTPKAHEMLVEMLEDPSTEVRSRASLQLRLHVTRPQWLVPKVSALSQHANEAIRAQAYKVLLRFASHMNEDPAAILDAALSDPCETVRESAIDALSYASTLAKFPASQAVRLLSQATNDPSPTIRQMALGSLVRRDLATPQARAMLLHVALHDSDPDIRAIAALDVGPPRSEPEFDALIAISLDSQVRDTGAVRFLARRLADSAHRSSAERRFLVAISSESHEVRACSAIALAEFPSNESREVLAEALRADRSPYVRRLALRSLFEILKEDAGDFIFRSLEDEDPRVREVAADLVGHLGSNAMAPKLISIASSDPSAQVRQRAIDSLANLQDRRRIRAFVRALDDEGVAVRQRAALALGKLGSTRAILYLLREAPREASARDALWRISERLAKRRRMRPHG